MSSVVTMVTVFLTTTDVMTIITVEITVMRMDVVCHVHIIMVKMDPVHECVFTCIMLCGECFGFVLQKHKRCTSLDAVHV